MCLVENLWYLGMCLYTKSNQIKNNLKKLKMKQNKMQDSWFYHMYVHYKVLIVQYVLTVSNFNQFLIVHLVSKSIHLTVQRYFMKDVLKPLSREVYDRSHLFQKFVSLVSI